MKDALISNKWEVIAYLSGVPMQSLHSRVPEWYIAIQDVLASLNIKEKAKTDN